MTSLPMSTKMCPKQQKTTDGAMIGLVLRRKRSSFKGDDNLTEFGGWVLRYRAWGWESTGNTVFREKQQSSVAGHWGKE